MNSIMVIHPYKDDGVRVFDDPAVGLIREPFVSGADDIIDRMVEGISCAEQGITLFYSCGPFPGFQYEFTRQREEFGGNWYSSRQFGMEGWLCPAMFEYFEQAPERLYVQVKPRSS